MKKKQKAPKPQTASKRTPSSRASTSLTANPSKWIRTSKPLILPDHVKKALQRLDEAGHVAYVVGGSVRDFLLGRDSKDHDIATSASPDELVTLFPDAVTVGKAFGVLKIPIRDPAYRGQLLEVAAFRQDLEYRDHRHAEGVKLAGPAEDARRRDLTINALFYDPKTARILDSVGGMDDLKAGIIRAIGDPLERFKEDALRLLRAVRFATCLDFNLEPQTEKAIRERSRLITKVSGERVRDELTLMLVGPRPAKAFRMLSELKLLRPILPEIETFKGVQQSSLYHPEGDVWEHTMKALDCLARENPKPSATLAWGTLLHDVGKPAVWLRSERKNFNGHEKDGVKAATEIGERLKMSRSDIEVIVWLVENHLKFKDVFQMRESTLQRFVRQSMFEELLALHRADAMASDGNLAYYEFCLRRLEEMRRSPRPESAVRLITGEDLIQLGLGPGPGFSGILRTIEDLALEGKIATKDEALEYVIKHFVR